MARGNTRGMLGRKAALDPKYAFGTDEEVAHRDDNAYQPSPTNFKQVGPEDNAGLNANEAPARRVGGDFKFDSV